MSGPKKKVADKSGTEKNVCEAVSPLLTDE